MVRCLFLPGLSDVSGAVTQKVYHSLMQRVWPRSQIPGSRTIILTLGLVTTECLVMLVPLSPAHYLLMMLVTSLLNIFSRKSLTCCNISIPAGLSPPDSLFLPVSCAGTTQAFRFHSAIDQHFSYTSRSRASSEFALSSGILASMLNSMS